MTNREKKTANRHESISDGQPKKNANLPKDIRYDRYSKPYALVSVFLLLVLLIVIGIYLALTVGD